MTFDFATFDSFFSTDSELLVTTLEMFLESIPISSEKIYDAIQSDDNEQLHINAHSLKSYVAYFTSGRLYQTAYKLELIGQEKQLPAQKDHALTLYDDLSPLVQQLTAAMNARLEMLKR